jgi:O-antigen/teichoic acid export membrane protein
MGYFSLLNFGMNTATIKYTAEHRARNEQEILNKTVSTILAILVLIAVFIILLCIGFAPFIPRLFHLTGDLVSVGQIAFLIMGLNVALGLLGGLFGDILYGYQRVDVFMAFGIIQAIANASFTITFLRLGFGLIGVVVASLLGVLIVMILYLFFIHRSNYGIVIHPRLADLKTLKRIGPYSIRSFVLGLTSQICFQTDNIVIGTFLLVSIVTPYSIAYQLCSIVVAMVGKITHTLFPAFSKLYALEDIDGLRSLYLKTSKISIAIYMPLALFLAIFGQSFINLWVGEENFVGMNVLLVLIFITFSHSFAGPSGHLLQAIGKNKEIMYLNIVMAVLNLTLSIILVQKIGLLGVALGTLVAHLCTGFWVVPLLVYKYIGLRVKTFLLSGILPPILVGIPAGAIAWVFIQDFLPNNNFFYLCLKGVLVVGIYAVIYLAIGATKEERQMYFDLLPRIGRR